MSEVVICIVCGAENPFDEDNAGRCYNCDNDLFGNTRKRSGRVEESENSSLQAVIGLIYLSLFILALPLYILACLDVETQVHPLFLALLMINIVQMMILRRVSVISGVSTLKNDFKTFRRLVYYLVVTDSFAEVFKLTQPGRNKGTIFYSFLMLQSLMLFYTYYFGKKRKGLNDFSFF